MITTAIAAVLRQLRGEQVMTGGSHCDGCERPLNALETLPLVSFAVARGHCFRCGDRIDPSHLVGELAGAAILAMAGSIPAPDLAGAMARCGVAAMGLLLMAIGLYDARTFRIPDRLSAGVFTAALFLAALNGLRHLAWAMLAGTLMFALLVAVRWIYHRLRGREGMGFGDVKLLAAVTVWLGPGSAWALALASLVALVTILLLGNTARRLPFAPFIALGAFTVGVWGQLTGAYA